MRKPKYEGVNPLEKLNRGEPFFLLRAQDRISSEAVKHYAFLLQQVADLVVKDKNLDQDEAMRLALSLEEQASEVGEIALQFIEWQKQNPDKVKLPD